MYIIFDNLMIKKFLKEVVIIVVGKQPELIVDLLYTNKHVNEFLISKKLEITINQTRNILYKLSDYGLVSFIRKKDKRKGWYTYFWKIEPSKSLEFLKEVLVKKHIQLNQQIKSKETKNFYSCKKCNREFNEETALAYDFTCDECGELFVLKDNNKVLKDLKKEVDLIEKEIFFIDAELNKEKEKLEKKRLKEFKKEEKEKEAKKAIQKALRKSLKESLKKSVKKPVKKILKKSTKKPLKKPTKKSTKKPIKKLIKKTSKKLIKKSIKKPIKTSKKTNKK
jgi:transcription factor E